MRVVGERPFPIHYVRLTTCDWTRPFAAMQGLKATSTSNRRDMRRGETPATAHQEDLPRARGVFAYIQLYACLLCRARRTSSLMPASLSNSVAHSFRSILRHAGMKVPRISDQVYWSSKYRCHDGFAHPGVQMIIIIATKTPKIPITPINNPLPSEPIGNRPTNGANTKRALAGHP